MVLSELTGNWNEQRKSNKQQDIPSRPDNSRHQQDTNV